MASVILYSLATTEFTEDFISVTSDIAALFGKCKRKGKIRFIVCGLSGIVQFFERDEVLDQS